VLTKQVQVEAKHILLGAAVVALAVGAYVLGQREGKDLVAGSQPTTTVTTEFVQPKDFVPFEDKETGIKLSIPREWQQRSTKNLGPAARMFVQVPNTDDTVLLRVNSYAKEVTAANIADQKSVIDSILASEKITILGVEQGDLRGMPVLVYIYSFTDPASGETGIHAHYFVFQGRKAVQLVFQALPQEHYTSGGLGLVWGKISDSLEIAPGPPPAFLEELGKGTTPATPAPGATTAPAPPPTG
jgi:hypothetical protein